MIKVIVILTFIFLSIGIYTRLAKFGAPASAIFYAGFIPITAFLFNIALGFDYVKKHKEIKGIKKLYTWIDFELFAINKLSLINSLFIAKIGSMKLQVWDLTGAFTQSYGIVFSKSKEYVECQVNKAFKCSYEDIVIKRGMC